MSSNPLPKMLLAYKITRDSFRIAERTIQTKEPKTRQRLLQRTVIENKNMTEAKSLIQESIKEADTLFVLNM